MILDLVSPWLSALDSTNPTQARELFRDRHVDLLEPLRRVRAPTHDTMPLCLDPKRLRPLARHAADPATQQRLRDALAAAARLGADAVTRVVLMAGDGGGDPMEALPYPAGDAVLFTEQLLREIDTTIALARAVALVTRWRGTGSESEITRLPATEWDWWELIRTVRLREWIYGEGVAFHLAQTLLPAVPPHELFGVNRAAFDRLRQREKVLRELLDHDLDSAGSDLVQRWLTPGSPTVARTVGRLVVPPIAGRYLAWRMTADRVERIGVGEALRMVA